LAGSEVAVAVDDDVWEYGPVAFDADLLGTLRGAADGVGASSLEMVSPAGHDAGYVARRVPTAMLFVPCRDGLSHHPAEWAEPEAVESLVRFANECPRGADVADVEVSEEEPEGLSGFEVR